MRDMAQFDNIITNNYITVVERVTCSVNLGCQLNLHQIAQSWYNVEYKDNALTVQLRNPDVTADISSKGEMLCFATSEEAARTGTRRIARMIQKEGFKVTLAQIRINVHARCTLPFQIRVGSFALRYLNTLYEPELHDAAEFEIPELNARLSIDTKGTIEITAPTRANVDRAAEHIYSRVREFRRE